MGNSFLEIDPSTDPLPSHAAGRGATGAGVGGRCGLASSACATLIFASAAGAAEQPNTVHPPFSAKHSQ
jgi:hypothetical protein